jgi:hypothetical protein
MSSYNICDTEMANTGTQYPQSETGDSLVYRMDGSTTPKEGKTYEMYTTERFSALRRSIREF